MYLLTLRHMHSLHMLLIRGSELSLKLTEITKSLRSQQMEPFFEMTTLLYVGRDRVAGIAIRCEMDGLGIESRWRKIFRNRTDRP